MIIHFTVLGIAQTAGSKRSYVPLDKNTKEPYRRPNGGIVVSTVEDNPKSKSWRQDIALAARRAYRGPLLSGALSVSMAFYRPRPQGHFGKQSLNKKGRETPYPISKPDVLKHARAAEDALTKVLWVDDAQIVDECLFKRWCEPGEPARTEIMIEEIDQVERPLSLLAGVPPPAPWETNTKGEQPDDSHC